MNAGTIRQTIEQIAVDVFGPEFKVLPQMFDIESNDSRSLIGGIAARWGTISEAPTRLDQYLSVEQDFFLDIAVRSFVGVSDNKSVLKIDAVYEKLSTVMKIAVQNKLGIKGVNEVRLGNVTEPRPFNDNQRDILKISVVFTVAYLIT